VTQPTVREYNAHVPERGELADSPCVTIPARQPVRPLYVPRKMSGTKGSDWKIPNNWGGAQGRGAQPPPRPEPCAQAHVCLEGAIPAGQITFVRSSHQRTQPERPRGQLPRGRPDRQAGSPLGQRSRLKAQAAVWRLVKLEPLNESRNSNTRKSKP
jgi:hypothetical protein